MKEVYRTTTKLTGKFFRAELPVKDATGNSIPRQDAQRTRLEEHFSNLLNRPLLSTLRILLKQTMILTSSKHPSEEEIISALKLLKSGKAARETTFQQRFLSQMLRQLGTFYTPFFKKYGT